MKTVKQHKSYDTNSSEEEIAYLKSLVSLENENLIVYKELPIISDFQLEVMWGKVKDLASREGAYFMFLDISEAQQKITAKQRAKLKKLIRPALEHINHMAVYTGRNMFINLTAKFVLGGIRFKSISLHKTKNQALKTLKNKRQKAFKASTKHLN